jgi:hypothetical protein
LNRGVFGGFPGREQLALLVHGEFGGPLDDVVLGLAQGLEGIDVVLEELEEALTGFSGEDAGFGGHVVFELALRRVRAFEAAFGSFGAFRLSAVGAGGLGALWGGLFFGGPFVFHFGRSLFLGVDVWRRLLRRSAAATCTPIMAGLMQDFVAQEPGRLLMGKGLAVFRFWNRSWRLVSLERRIAKSLVLRQTAGPRQTHDGSVVSGRCCVS